MALPFKTATSSLCPFLSLTQTHTHKLFWVFASVQRVDRPGSFGAGGLIDVQHAIDATLVSPSAPAQQRIDQGRHPSLVARADEMGMPRWACFVMRSLRGHYGIVTLRPGRGGHQSQRGPKQGWVVIDPVLTSGKESLYLCVLRTMSADETDGASEFRRRER